MDEKIAVAGDWHGDEPWAVTVIQRLRHEGIQRVLHVGDFGIDTWNQKSYLAPLEAELAKSGITIYVTPGNHENYDLIESLTPLAEGENAGWLPLTEHVLLAPRGLRWSWSGVKLASLGGGNSINWADLRPHIDWWPAESITEADLYNLEAGVAQWGPADVMIAHVAPDIVDYALPDGRWPVEAVRYSNESREYMRYAVEIVQPHLFFHGHYHVAKEQDVMVEAITGQKRPMHVVSLGKNQDKNNLALLTLSTLEVELIPSLWRDRQGQTLFLGSEA